MLPNTHSPFDDRPPSYLATATMPQPISSPTAGPHCVPPVPAKQDTMSSPPAGQPSAPPTPAKQHLTSFAPTVQDTASPERAPSTAPRIERAGRPAPLRTLSPIPITTLFPTTLPPRPAPIQYPWNLRFCMFPRPTIAPRPQDMEMGVLPQRRVPVDGHGLRDGERGRGLMNSPVQQHGSDALRTKQLKKWRWIIGTSTIVIGFWMLIVIGIRYGGRSDVNRT
jgi:hypothetical protein